MITAADAGTYTLGDRTVRRMGFGSMRITANPDRGRALQVLRTAVELGVNHIDTAAFYVSPGGTLGIDGGPTRHAAELIRAALSPYPEDLVIATKVGPAYDPEHGWHQARTAAELRQQVEANLRLLGRDYLDVVNLRIFRRPGQDSIAERFGALADMRADGLIRHLGLSNVRLDHLDEAQEIAPVACVQNLYGIDINRTDDAFVDECGRRNVAYVPFFSLAGDHREAGGFTDHGDAVLAVAQAHGATPQQVRLAWTLHRGDHLLSIPGTGNPQHVAENIAASALRLSPQEMALLSTA